MFRVGHFTEPALTAEEMIDRCTTFAVRQSMSTTEEARRLMREVIPTLKRWRHDPPAA